MTTLKTWLAVAVVGLATFPCVTRTLHQDELCDADEMASNGVASDDDDVSLNVGDGVRVRVKREFVPYKSGKTVAGQVSSALDRLLVNSGYDKRIRPQLGGPPIPVVINLSIRSMGPVDEGRQVFSLDCYFRQTWVDPRLKYNATGVTELALNWAFVAKIWVPDTFIVNGKKSYLHKITVPNRFIRISPNGRVSYSQRLTIWANCPMNLQKFPLDSQICLLTFGSFGYSSDDILYHWKKPSAVSVDEVGMAQFVLKEYQSYEKIEVSNRRTKLSFRNDSVATLEFLFERQTGFFLLQIYTPLTLIVFCSWVAFWLMNTANVGVAAGRTALGATSVLSVVNIGFGGKARPQVGYPTALDMFIILCFVTVFAALVEFACISSIDTYFKHLKEKHEAAKKAKEEAEAAAKKAREAIEKAILGSATSLPISIVTMSTDDVISKDEKVRVIETPEDEDTRERVVLVTIQSHSQIESIADSGPPLAEVENGGDDDHDFEDIAGTDGDGDDKSALQRCRDFWSAKKTQLFDRIEAFAENRWGPIEKTYIYENTADFLYSIDENSQKMFPLVFLILQFIYWTSYLYIL